jgi:hypothetical protein
LLKINAIIILQFVSKVIRWLRGGGFRYSASRYSTSAAVSKPTSNLKAKDFIKPYGLDTVPAYGAGVLRFTVLDNQQQQK